MKNKTENYVANETGLIQLETKVITFISYFCKYEFLGYEKRPHLTFDWIFCYLNKYIVLVRKDHYFTRGNVHWLSGRLVINCEFEHSDFLTQIAVKSMCYKHILLWTSAFALQGRNWLQKCMIFLLYSRHAPDFPEINADFFSHYVWMVYSAINCGFTVLNLPCKSLINLPHLNEALGQL